MKPKAFLFLLSLLLILPTFSQPHRGIITRGGISSITEEDGSPETFPYQVKFTNATVTDNADGTTSVDVSGIDTHDILDGSTHTDSVADAVTRGSLIYGNSTPKWDELVIGAAGTVLSSDGTDVSWVANSTTAAHTILDNSFHTDSASQGVTRGSIIYGNATPAWDELAVGTAGQALTSDGTDISWIGGNGTGEVGFWNRTGTELSPINAGDDVKTTGNISVSADNSTLSLGSTGVMQMYVDSSGETYFDSTTVGKPVHFRFNETSVMGEGIGIYTSGGVPGKPRVRIGQGAPSSSEILTVKGPGGTDGIRVVDNTNDAQYVRLETAAGSMYLSASNDRIFMQPSLGFVGWFSSSNAFSMYRDKNFHFSEAGGDGADFRWDTGQTVPTLQLGLADYTTGLGGKSRSIIVIDTSDRTFNFGHGNQINPTIFIHSANRATDEWISFAHDQTDGIIDVGTGTVKVVDELRAIGITNNPQLSVAYDDSNEANFTTDPTGNLSIFTSGGNVIVSGTVTIANASDATKTATFAVDAAGGLSITTTNDLIDFGAGDLSTTGGLSGASLSLTGDASCDNINVGDGVIADNVTINDTLLLSPSTAQVIDAAGDTILANAVAIVLNPDANHTLTSTPTIADGTTGQLLYITSANAEVNVTTVQDQDTLGSSNLHLGAASRAISGKDVLALFFDGTTWNEVSYANN